QSNHAVWQIPGGASAGCRRSQSHGSDRRYRARAEDTIDRKTETISGCPGAAQSGSCPGADREEQLQHGNIDQCWAAAAASDAAQAATRTRKSDKCPTEASSVG